MNIMEELNNDIKSNIQKVNKLENLDNLTSEKQKDNRTWQEKSRSDSATSKGDLKIQKYKKYYDVGNTITTAQATNPNDPDNVNYNQERVFELLERNAEKILVINDNPPGGATLFVIMTHTGSFSWSRERSIFPGERKMYYDVYELRLRSAVSGSSYRVVEYEITTR